MSRGNPSYQGFATSPHDVIRVYAKVPRTQAMGPFLRFALWVQGCPLRCPGCMTPDALPFDGGETVPVERLAQEILAIEDIEGVTISGGEPVAQAASLAALMQRLRSKRDLGLILYSGYRLAALRRLARTDAGVSALLGQIDLLIDGPYLASENDGAPLRGSLNQRVLPLTDRYRECLAGYDQDHARHIEVHVEIGVRMLVGIPSRRQLAWWQARKG